MKNLVGEEPHSAVTIGKLKQACSEFLKSPRERVYLEQQDGFWTVKAKETIKSFEIIGIYYSGVDLSKQRDDQKLNDLSQEEQLLIQEIKSLKTPPISLSMSREDVEKLVKDKEEKIKKIKAIKHIQQEYFDVLENGMWISGACNGQHFRNSITEATDSFPNATLMMPIPNLLGLQHCHVMVALEAISPGDLICYTYGMHHQVRNSLSHQEFRKEALEKEMEMFLKKHSFKEWIEAIEAFMLWAKGKKPSMHPKQKKLSSDLDTFETLSEKFIYTLITFPGCVYLMQKKILTINDVLLGLLNPTICSEIIDTGPYNKILFLYKGIQKDPSILDELSDQIFKLTPKELLEIFVKKGLI